MEVLVVVLIVGILAAVAVPQYQKAVLKSRYSALMPIAKSIANGNEIYYMEHGSYASDPADLDVTGQAEYPTGTELTLGDSMEYAYVLASNPSLNNHYIVYQKHSEQFPGETHCEALKTDKRANWLCQEGLKGERIGGSLTSGYNTYLLEGTGSGVTASTAAVLAGVACPEGSAEDACKVTENTDGSKTKMECSTPGDSGTCTYTTTNTDGSTTVCNGQYGKNENGKCMPTGKGTYEVTTDEDGNRVEKKCSSWNATQQGCSATADNEYDSNNNQTSQTYRTCSGFNADGSCSGYSGGIDFTWGYDANNNRTSQIYRTCSGFNADGSCSGYSGGIDYTYGYDANNNKTSVINRRCSGFNADGSCSGYSSGYIVDYTTSPSTRTECNSEAECAELLGAPLPYAQ